ncbi:MAG: hypothetical protein JXA09_08135 [Anaerolineae bacterium]|nr:hypothetical protein [Anaerolineae bacterium]
MNGARARHATRWVLGLLIVLSLTVLLGRSAQTQYYGLGDIPLDPETYQKYLKVRPRELALEMDQALPVSYDARSEGIVTSAKNQGSCGSCWAFASVGGFESHVLKLQDPAYDFSEQQQVSCNTSMWGCSGGSASAIRYWEGKGTLEEPCFPYTASDSTPCAEDSCVQFPYRVIDYHTVPATTADFKASLYTYGPSYWRFDVYSDFYTFWNDGVPGQVYVQSTGGYEGGHAVLLIGWDDDKGAFLCKNSWGSGGPNNDGTFWIAYGGHGYDLSFGMSNFSLTMPHYCGDGTCDADEGPCDCPGDCGPPPATETSCTDGEDNDCDGLTDCDDSHDCGSDPACQCGNGACEAGEDCQTCPGDCISGSSGGTCEACFKGVCDGACHPVKEGPDCADCAPGYCCGDGVCEGAEDGTNCAIDCGAPPVCGDGTCDSGETSCNCAADCGLPLTTEVTYCSDGLDNDCDGAADCGDSDCASDPACDCLPLGASCSVNDECCSNKCAGRKCR